MSPAGASQPRSTAGFGPGGAGHQASESAVGDTPSGVRDSPTRVVVKVVIDQISGVAPWFESAAGHPNRSAETSARGTYASVLVGRCTPTIQV